MEELELLRIRSRFMNAVYADFGLNSLVELASDILGNPVHIIDASDRIIAACNQIRTRDSYMRPMIEQGILSDTELKKMQHANFKARVFAVTQATIMSRTSDSSVKGILAPIRIQGEPVAYTCCLNMIREFSPDDTTIMDEANKAFSIELQKSRIYQDNRGTRLGYQLMDLLETNGDTLKLEEIRFRGWSAKEYSYLLAIPFKQKYRDNKRRSNILLHIFEETLRGSIVALTEYGLVVLLSQNEPFVPENDKYKRLEELLKVNDLRAGCSPRVEDLRFCRDYFAEAKKAVELNELMGGERVITNYEDVYFFHMVQLFEKHIPLNHICVPGMLELKCYDKKHGTNYYETIIVYLTNMKSVSLTTEILQIHRNTLYARLEKIKELMGVSLDNIDTVMNILLTIKMQEWQERTYATS